MASSNAAGIPKKKLGVTPPRSLEGPLRADLRSTEELEKFFVESGLYKSKEESTRQEEVLGKLDKVDGPGADIDTLCVGPNYMNREQGFFTILYGILAQTEEVTELQPVPDAHVPVMKFKLHGISINLLYASVSLPVVPSDLDLSKISAF